MKGTGVVDSAQQLSWFALHVRTNKEQLTEWTLTKKGYEIFLPMMTETRLYCRKRKRFLVPCFKGYLFCKLDPLQRLDVLKTPHVYRVVGRGMIPEPIPDSELNAVKTLIAAGVPLEHCAYPSVGERVRIERGPLIGIEGVLLDLKNSRRIVVSITLLRRSVSVEVSAGDVTSADVKTRSCGALVSA